MQIALREHFYNPKCTELSQIGKNKTKQNTLTKDKLTTKNYKPSEKNNPPGENSQQTQKQGD